MNEKRKLVLEAINILDMEIPSTDQTQRVYDILNKLYSLIKVSEDWRLIKDNEWVASGGEEYHYLTVLRDINNLHKQIEVWQDAYINNEGKKGITVKIGFLSSENKELLDENYDESRWFENINEGLSFVLRYTLGKDLKKKKKIPLKKDMLDALSQFKDEALRLSIIWEDGCEELDKIMKKNYPFDNSFDEIAHSLSLYYEDVEKQLKNR